MSEAQFPLEQFSALNLAGVCRHALFSASPASMSLTTKLRRSSVSTRSPQDTDLAGHGRLAAAHGRTGARNKIKVIDRPVSVDEEHAGCDG